MLWRKFDVHKRRTQRGLWCLRQKPRFHITSYWLLVASCGHFEHWGNEERPFWKNMSEMCVVQLELWKSFIHSQVGPSAVWRILAQQQLAAKQITSLRKSAAGSSSHIYRSSIDHVRISEPSFDILWLWGDCNELYSAAPGESAFKIIDCADQTQCHDFKHRSDLRHCQIRWCRGMEVKICFLCTSITYSLR